MPRFLPTTNIEEGASYEWMTDQKQLVELIAHKDPSPNTKTHNFPFHFIPLLFKLLLFSCPIPFSICFQFLIFAKFIKLNHFPFSGGVLHKLKRVKKKKNLDSHQSPNVFFFSPLTIVGKCNFPNPFFSLQKFTKRVMQIYVSSLIIIYNLLHFLAKHI